MENKACGKTIEKGKKKIKLDNRKKKEKGEKSVKTTGKREMCSR